MSQSWPNGLGEEERGGKRAKRKREGKCGIFRERSSTFSLEFPAIGPASSDEARSKVAPHDKEYTWVPVSAPEKGRGFIQLVLFLV